MTAFLIPFRYDVRKTLASSHEITKHDAAAAGGVAQHRGMFTNNTILGMTRVESWRIL